MTSIDDKIKQALNEEFNEIIDENNRIDSNPFTQMGAGFKNRMGWMYLLVVIITSLFAFMTFYSIYRFYYAVEIKPIVAWGVSIVMFGLFTQVSKMWYWSELGRNRVIREIKVLELQLALVLKNQEKE